MNRFKKLHRYPRAILILLAAMTLVFTALYLAASARKGFLYQDALLLPEQTEGGCFCTTRTGPSRTRA